MKTTVRKAIKRSVIEMATFEGQRTGKPYLIVKGHVNKATFYQAFTSVELKIAVLDIEGKEDTEAERRKINSAKEAAKIWERNH